MEDCLESTLYPDESILIIIDARTAEGFVEGVRLEAFGRSARLVPLPPGVLCILISPGSALMAEEAQW